MHAIGMQVTLANRTLMKPTPPTFRPDIEGLRGIAILLVVAYHAKFPFIGGGFIGVDIFFVLSGYLIFGILLKEWDKTESISFLNFYARRARRLLPASFMMLVPTMVAAYLIFPPIEQKHLPESALSSVLYSSNLYFLRIATDYLGNAPDRNPFLHTWSLSVEEQFYLLFPVATFLTLRYLSRRSLVIVIGGIALISLAGCVYFTYSRQPIAFFSSVTRAWEFAAGALGVLYGFPKTGRMRSYLGLGGMAALVVSVVLYVAAIPFPGLFATVPVIGTFAVLVAGTDSISGRLLDNRILHFFGRISYSWYLWHWPIFVFAKELFGPLTPYSVSLSIVFSLCIAYASLVVVENPIRFNRYLSPYRKITLAAAAVLTIVGAGSAIGFWANSSRALVGAEQARFSRAKEQPVGTEKCDLDAYESEPRECVFADEGSTKTVVLFGDSHAIHWFAAVRAIAEERRWRLVTLFKSGCSPVDISYKNASIARRYVECEDWRSKSIERINEMHPDTVLIAGFQRVGEDPDGKSVPLEYWISGMHSTFEKLGPSGAQLAYFRDTPRPGFDVLACLARNAWYGRPSADDCSFPRARALNDEVASAEEKESESSDVSYVDIDKYVCPLERCLAEKNGIIFYRDDDHLTNEAVLSIKNELMQEILSGRSFGGRLRADDVTVAGAND